MFVVSTFADFLTAAAFYTAHDAPKDWRKGQAAFNLLCRIRPELAEMIRGSDFDPFYQDSRLTDFYDYLCRHWDDALTV